MRLDRHRYTFVTYIGQMSQWVVITFFGRKIVCIQNRTKLLENVIQSPQKVFIVPKNTIVGQ